MYTRIWKGEREKERKSRTRERDEAKMWVELRKKKNVIEKRKGGKGGKAGVAESGCRCYVVLVVHYQSCNRSRVGRGCRRTLTLRRTEGKSVSRHEKDVCINFKIEKPPLSER